MKKLAEELFSTQDRDNKYSTTILETLVKTAIKTIIKELEDKTKAVYKYLSIYGTEYPWEHFPDTTKKVMLGIMVINDPADI